MSERSKKIFLLVTIFGSFLVYCIIYYAQIFREAPYNFKEFKSFVIKYGTRDSMVNYYNSATGEYDYLNKQNSLIRTHVYLTKTDLDSVHRDASKLGFWDFPDYELNTDTTDPRNADVPRYFIRFNYKRKSKQVTFDANYNGPIKLIDANKVMITDIRDVLSKAEDRQDK